MSSKSKTTLCFLIALFVELFLIGEFFYCLRLPECFPFSVCLVRFIVCSIICFSGFVCSFYYSDNFDTRPIIFFLYSYSAFLFCYDFATSGSVIYPDFVYIFNDLFGFLVFIFCMTFISRAFKNSKKNSLYKKRIFFLYIIFALLFVIKYLFIFFKQTWSVSNNPFNSIIGITLLFLLIATISLFVYLLKASSRVATMMLRYLILGIFLSFSSGMMFTIKNAVAGIPAFNDAEIISMVIGSSFLAICVLFSFFQFKSEKVNIVIRKILSFLVFAEIAVITLYFCNTYLNVIAFDIAVTVFILLSPVLYRLLFIPINTYLSLENKTTIAALKEFEEKISQVDDIDKIFAISGEELKKQLDSRHVFIRVKDAKGAETTVYSDTTEFRIKIQLAKFDNEKGKKTSGVIRFKDGSLVYVVLTNIEYTIYFYIGKKVNNDFYLPSEISYTQRYINIIYQQLISEYSKDVSKELESVSKHSKQLDQELLLAANVQQSFYPKNVESFNKWEVQSYCKAMAGVSGDLYDFYSNENELKGVGVFDVSGHGIASGLVTMLVRNIIQKEFYKNLNKPLDEVMFIIDERFKREKNEIQNFMSGILLRFNDNKVEFSNGGHPYPIIYKKKTDSLFFMDKEFLPTGTFIGFNDFIQPEFHCKTMDFEPGDEIILYTDGINEALNENREQYNYKRLLETVQKNIKEDIKTQKEKLLEDVTNFVGSAPANDDITFVILRRM